MINGIVKNCRRINLRDAALAAFCMLVVAATCGLSGRSLPPAGQYAGPLAIAHARRLPPPPPPAETGVELPEVLSAKTAETYRRIFAAQDQKDWTAASRLSAQLGDRTLLGHVLADRYLSKSYTATYADLHHWLAAYSDLPQAADIHPLAVARRKSADPRLPAAERRPVLKGYGDDNGLASRSGRQLSLVGEEAWQDRPLARKFWQSVEQDIGAGELDAARLKLSSGAPAMLLKPFETDVARWHLASRLLYQGRHAEAYRLAAAAARSAKDIPAVRWVAGLAAWHLNDRRAAYRQFALMAQEETGLSPWERSAAAFWSHRAARAAGEDAAARRYLEVAASYPRTFYGVLACKILGRGLGVAGRQPELTRSQLRQLMAEPAVKRAVALKQIGQDRLAERELRALFPQAPEAARVQLLALAQALELPAVQISMARQLTRSGQVFDQALYPTPPWQPAGGFAVDPALIFAFARQESGFNTVARSPVGAMGVMQLMPGTARDMLARAEIPAITQDNLFEPEANLGLGQSYLNHLMSEPSVGGNLIFLAAAYNAGPANLIAWKKNISHRGDPLLFMESIPFAETRHYVGQVLTSYWVYQELQGRRQTSALALSQGSWPRYDAGDAGRAIETAAAGDAG